MGFKIFAYISLIFGVTYVTSNVMSISAQGIYDIHTQLQGVPVLPWEPPPLSNNIYASEIMSYPVIAFKTVEKVSHIIYVLKNETHNGFPVVDPVPVSIIKWSPSFQNNLNSPIFRIPRTMKLRSGSRSPTDGTAA